jgi:beta-alanine--pyruvate transaminase
MPDTLDHTLRTAPPAASQDLDAWWMPFTANRDFKASPRLLVSAKDMHYRSHDGRTILDGTAGLWCVNAGHAQPRIVQAIAESAQTLDFAPTFQMGHPSGFELAERLIALTKNKFSNVFYVNSGSEAVDTALKMAIAYHRARGEGTRTRLIGRERGYHGVGFGGISVGGIANNRKWFGPLMTGVDHLRHTHDPARNAFSRGVPAHGAEFADDLERIVALHDASTIAAVIVEPVAGSTGVLLPPAGYLKRLRDICTKHGILLIFDEVITGFGRLGAPFATDLFGVEPDLMTVAKGITNGCVPMGAVFTKSHVHDAFMNGPEGAIEFFHGYTYSGHPLACAAGLATLDVYEQTQAFANAAALAPVWEDALHALRDRRNVIDIRNIGLVGGVELSSRDGQPGARGMEAFKKAYEAGILVRFTGDIIAMSPPLIIDRDQIGELTATLGRVLDTVA